MGVTEDPVVIARLEARVAELEALLERRSRELRLFQKHMCHRDLIVLSRITAGLFPLPFGPFEPEFWPESTHLTTAEVGDTMEALWSSLSPDLPKPR